MLARCFICLEQTFSVCIKFWEVRSMIYDLVFLWVPFTENIILKSLGPFQIKDLQLFKK